MRFRPTLGATVAALAVLAVLLGLGTWQIDRRAESAAQAALRAARIAAPPLGLADVEVASAAALAAMEFRPIRLAGRYLAAAEIKLLNRTRDGRPGYQLVAPLQTADGAATVLVDRGWAPLDGPPPAPPPAEPVTVEGYIRLFAPPARFIPSNDPAAATWFWLDRDAIAAAFGLRGVVPYYVQRAPGEEGRQAYPAGAVPDTALRRPHLQYALTWYGLAVALVVIYLVYHLRRGREPGEDGQ